MKQYKKTHISQMQKRFIEEKEKDPNISDYSAALKAGYTRSSALQACKISSSVGRFLNNGQGENKKLLAERLGLSKEKIIKGIVKLLDSNKEGSIAKGLELGMKLHGLFDPEKHEITNPAQEIVKLPKEELEAKVKEIMGTIETTIETAVDKELDKAIDKELSINNGSIKEQEEGKDININPNQPFTAQQPIMIPSQARATFN